MAPFKRVRIVPYHGFRVKLCWLNIALPGPAALNGRTISKFFDIAFEGCYTPANS